MGFEQRPLSEPDVEPPPPPPAEVGDDPPPDEPAELGLPPDPHAAAVATTNNTPAPASTSRRPLLTRVVFTPLAPFDPRQRRGLYMRVKRESAPR